MSTQTKGQHTPGPWKEGRADMATLVDGVSSKWIYCEETGPGAYVAVASGMGDRPWVEVMANARLIAAAPDLLAACEGAEITLSALARQTAIDSGRRRLIDERLQVARAAIAKARGEG